MKIPMLLRPARAAQRSEARDLFLIAPQANLKTAKQIGLTIPPNVLARADKVIK